MHLICDCQRLSGYRVWGSCPWFIYRIVYRKGKEVEVGALKELCPFCLLTYTEWIYLPFHEVTVCQLQYNVEQRLIPDHSALMFSMHDWSNSLNQFIYRRVHMMSRIHHAKVSTQMLNQVISITKFNGVKLRLKFIHSLRIGIS